MCHTRRLFIPGARVPVHSMLVFGIATLIAGSSVADARGRRRPKLPGVAIDKNHLVGKPHRMGRLAVFPVYARKQRKVGKFVTLREAVARNKAAVSELGTARARVSTILVINRGSDPILILGGTVILGGKQDRQIGEDTIVGARSKTRVKVFCVEKGRWSEQRGGKATRGKFTVLEVLASRTVRNAGQYRSSQSAVWRNVAKYNRKAGKRSRTGSLLVSVNDKKIKKRRKKLTARAIRYLDRLRLKKRVVGLAFAVAGKLTSVRWFCDHGVYRRFRMVLLNTAATEALIAKKPKRRRYASAGDVKQFLAKLSKARRMRTDKRRHNTNYLFSGSEAQGYRSATYYRAAKRYARGRRPRAAPPRARPRHAPVTVDNSVE